MVVAALPADAGRRISIDGNREGSGAPRVDDLTSGLGDEGWGRQRGRALVIVASTNKIAPSEARDNDDQRDGGVPDIPHGFPLCLESY
jgi:hypothetical protein